MLCGQCLLCFYALSLSDVTALGLLCLVLFHSVWIEHCSRGATELGFSLTPLSRGLFSICGHLRVQCFIAVHLGGEHLVFSFHFGGLDHWGPLPSSHCANPSLLSVLHFSQRGQDHQLRFIIPGMNPPSIPWSLSLGAAGEGRSNSSCSPAATDAKREQLFFLNGHVVSY